MEHRSNNMKFTQKERQELLRIGRMLCNSTDRIAIRAHLDKLPDDSRKMIELHNKLHAQLELCVGNVVRISESGKVRSLIQIEKDQATQQTVVSLPIQVKPSVKSEINIDTSIKTPVHNKGLEPSIAQPQQDTTVHVTINHSVIFKARSSDSISLFSISIQGAEIVVWLNKEHPMCPALFSKDIQQIPSGVSVGSFVHEPARMLIEGWALMEATTTGPTKERLSQIREEWGRKLGKRQKTL